VVDRVTARQYVVRDDFSEQEIDEAYRFPADSYATLIPQVQARTSIQSRILQVLLPLIRWPGVLVPVMIIFGVLLVTRRVRAGRESRL
jgi:hypothetical protein